MTTAFTVAVDVWTTWMRDQIREKFTTRLIEEQPLWVAALVAILSAVVMIKLFTDFVTGIKYVIYVFMMTMAFLGAVIVVSRAVYKDDRLLWSLFVRDCSCA